MRLKSLVACLAVTPILIGASAPVRIPPSSKWVLDYADDSCRLIRQFGEGKSLAKLVFRGVSPGELTMMVVGGTLLPLDGVVKARLLPGTNEPFNGTAAQADGPVKGAAFWTSVPLTESSKDSRKSAYRRPQHDDVRKTVDLVEREAMRAKRAESAASTTEVSIVPVNGRAMILETGSLGKPLAMFDECERDLLREWGVDPAIQDKIVKQVWTPNFLAWFNSDDYPAGSFASNEESTVSVRLAIDSSGKVTKCASVSAYAAKDFDKVVCNVMLTRAKFAPAELADGTKVASYFSQRVTFKMAR